MATVEAPTKEVRAEAKYVRTAPRKAQLVLEQIRGRRVPEARTILTFMSRDAARDVEKVLNSAVANAEANHDLVGDELYVSAAYAGSGPTLKRWRARARGRVARIKKRTCHITIRLAEVDGASAAVVTPPAEEAKPKRAPRKQAAVPDTPTEAVEAPEDKPKTRPKRAQKPKAEAAETAATTEEKPKRTRAAKPKADEPGEEKPKRAPRKKKTEGEDS
jgi:large subunit ribosomal protein L22